jgi:hypothetical protein
VIANEVTSASIEVTVKSMEVTVASIESAPHPAFGHPLPASRGEGQSMNEGLTRSLILERHLRIYLADLQAAVNRLDLDFSG